MARTKPLLLLLLVAVGLGAPKGWAQPPPPNFTQRENRFGRGPAPPTRGPERPQPTPYTQPFAPPGVPPAAAQPGQGQPASVRPIESGQIIARVGDEVILAADVLPRVNQIIEEGLSKMPPGQDIPASELEKVRQGLMMRELRPLIETKLLFVDARRTIPKENFPTIQEKLEARFEEVEYPRLMEESKATSRAELDAKLIRAGSSLAQEKRLYAERLLASQWLGQQINHDVQITHNEMLDYYRKHLKDYEFEAQCRWEQLMVRFDRFPSKAEAYRALAQMGNQVWHGASLADVARAGSQGPTAADGGIYDWTTLGSLQSQALNRAIFTLPVGQLSKIIEDEDGFHIVRVIERHDAGRKPFVEAQVEIRKILERENRNQQMAEYLTRLKKDTSIWTIFSADPGQGNPQVGARGGVPRR